MTTKANGATETHPHPLTPSRNNARVDTAAASPRLRATLQLLVLKVIDSAKAKCKGHVQHAYELKGNTRSSSVIEDKEKKLCSFVMPSSGYDEKFGVVGLAESQMRES